MVQIENLSFGYQKNKNVLENMNLNLQPGNVYGLLGENGSGKSSLMSLMAGLLLPINGNCKMDNFKTFERTPTFLQEVFLLPEEINTPTISIKQFLKVYAPFYPNFSKSQFQNYIKEFDLEEAQKFTELSLGQKKKALIAFALATNTKLLLLDEPTNGLDIQSKSQFRKIVAGVASDDRIIVISTHQVRDLESLIDPIIILANKNVLINASIDEIAQKLCFKSVSKLTELDNVLHAEKTVRGYSVVTENTNDEQTRTDLELLFIASIANQNKIMDIFNK